MKWRRYRLEGGATWQTFEVPASVIGVIGAKRLKEELERAERKMARLTRRAKAERMLAQGTKPAAVAHELDLSEAMVRRYRQQMKKERQ